MYLDNLESLLKENQDQFVLITWCFNNSRGNTICTAYSAKREVAALVSMDHRITSIERCQL